MQVQTAPMTLWSRATFPSAGLREDFLDQIRVWNGIEDLPRIDAEPLPDGIGVKFVCRDHRQHGLHKLIDSFGGRITFDMARGLPTTNPTDWP